MTMPLLTERQVYGPHISMLFGRQESQEHIKFLGHYFNPNATLADKLALAGSSYELVHSIPAIPLYFGTDPKKAWLDIATHEEKLASTLLTYLNSRKDITVYGETSPDPRLRVPTISFKAEGRSSQSVVEEVERSSSLGIRWGHFFSYRLVTEVLGLPKEGVVRVSMVHYNTGKLIILCPSRFRVDYVVKLTVRSGGGGTADPEVARDLNVVPI
jgi:selenocysteine lyase/cysteine desulfurase